MLSVVGYLDRPRNMLSCDRLYTVQIGDPDHTCPGLPSGIPIRVRFSLGLGFRV